MDTTNNRMASTKTLERRLARQDPCITDEDRAQLRAGRSVDVEQDHRPPSSACKAQPGTAAVVGDDWVSTTVGGAVKLAPPSIGPVVERPHWGPVLPTVFHATWEQYITAGLVPYNPSEPSLHGQPGPSWQLVDTDFQLWEVALALCAQWSRPVALNWRATALKLFRQELTEHEALKLVCRLDSSPLGDRYVARFLAWMTPPAATSSVRSNNRWWRERGCGCNDHRCCIWEHKAPPHRPDWSMSVKLALKYSQGHDPGGLTTAAIGRRVVAWMQSTGVGRQRTMEAYMHSAPHQPTIVAVYTSHTDDAPESIWEVTADDDDLNVTAIQVGESSLIMPNELRMAYLVGRSMVGQMVEVRGPTRTTRYWRRAECEFAPAAVVGGLVGTAAGILTGLAIAAFSAAHMHSAQGAWVLVMGDSNSLEVVGTLDPHNDEEDLPVATVLIVPYLLAAGVGSTVTVMAQNLRMSAYWHSAPRNDKGKKRKGQANPPSAPAPANAKRENRRKTTKRDKRHYEHSPPNPPKRTTEELRELREAVVDSSAFEEAPTTVTQGPDPIRPHRNGDRYLLLADEGFEALAGDAEPPYDRPGPLFAPGVYFSVLACDARNGCVVQRAAEAGWRVFQLKDPRVADVQALLSVSAKANVIDGLDQMPMPRKVSPYLKPVPLEPPAPKDIATQDNDPLVAPEVDMFARNMMYPLSRSSSKGMYCMLADLALGFVNAVGILGDARSNETMASRIKSTILCLVLAALVYVAKRQANAAAIREMALTALEGMEERPSFKYDLRHKHWVMNYLFMVNTSKGPMHVDDITEQLRQLEPPEGPDTPCINLFRSAESIYSKLHDWGTFLRFGALGYKAATWRTRPTTDHNSFWFFMQNSIVSLGETVAMVYVTQKLRLRTRHQQQSTSIANREVVARRDVAAANTWRARNAQVYDALREFAPNCIAFENTEAYRSAIQEGAQVKSGELAAAKCTYHICRADIQALKATLRPYPNPCPKLAQLKGAGYNDFVCAPNCHHCVLAPLAETRLRAQAVALDIRALRAKIADLTPLTHEYLSRLEHNVDWEATILANQFAPMYRPKRVSLSDPVIKAVVANLRGMVQAVLKDDTTPANLESMRRLLLNRMRPNPGPNTAKQVFCLPNDLANAYIDFTIGSFREKCDVPVS